jgi:signal transduction histidine kinase
MSHKILIQVTAPAVLIGLVLFGTCLVSAWHVNRLQTNMTDILTQNVSSLQAAQQLEISVQQLQFHCFLYLVDPAPALLEAIHHDHENFEKALTKAEQSALTPKEIACVAAIEKGYALYQQEFERLRGEVARGGARTDYRNLADAHPLRHVLDPCHEYFEINEKMMRQTADGSVTVSNRLHRTMLLLGLGGPLGGLLGGYGIARGLSRSLRRLSVRVHDVAQQLDQDVAAVSLLADGDLGHLDAQLQQVVARVAEVMERLQQQQREMFRSQQLAAVGQLAASIAHEVRNPLTSIKMLVEAGLRPRKPRPFTDDNLQVIHGEILRLEQTVQNFLDFARPALQRGCVDLCVLIERAVELVRGRARQQHVEIQVHGPKQPLWAQVDRNQLCTVLVNLFFNALDAMPTGGRLTIELDAVPGKGVRLSVSDTGAGIPADILPRVFDPFITSKPTGSGLGLNTCEWIIKEHHGSLTAHNRPAGGA